MNMDQVIFVAESTSTKPTIPQKPNERERHGKANISYRNDFYATEEKRKTNKEQYRETFENSDIIVSMNLNHSESVDINEKIQVFQCLKCPFRGPPSVFINPLYCSLDCLRRSEVHFLQKENVRLTEKKDLPLAAKASEISDDTNRRLEKESTRSDDNISNKNSQDLVAYPWMCSKKGFLWKTYLNFFNAIAAPENLFKDAFPYRSNGFQPGMKLEGVDPQHPSYFCVLSVVEVTGYRIRLHFDGYPDNYDVWVNADSMEIFPKGWSKKNNRVLHPPPGYTIENFTWADYLKQTKSSAAPKHLFADRTENATPSKFRNKMKLEAVDRKKPSLVCVATVRDMMYNRILVHFDGRDDIDDYWADSTSPYIHPVGWSNLHGLSLTPPNDYPNPEKFTWDKYLKDTESVPAPERAFKQRPPCNFEREMRLECVDKRAPHIIRVATVDQVQEHQIRIRFDGWRNCFGYWVDKDSPDIHPVGWCLKTGHPLEPPLTPDDVYKSLGCPTVGCRGLGHINGPNNPTHSNQKFCPYAEENIHLENVLPDRFQSLHLQRPDSSELEESQNVCNAIQVNPEPQPVEVKPMKRKYTKRTKADLGEPVRKKTALEQSNSILPVKSEHEPEPIKKKPMKRKYTKRIKPDLGEEINKRGAINFVEESDLLKRKLG